ncbi:MAG: DUF4249 family protein [Leadbetterella sp.]
MKKYIISLSIATIALFNSACTETNNVVASGDKPVIIAYLNPGSRIELSIKTEIPYSENAEAVSTSIDNLSVSIKGSDGSNYTLKSIGGGVYQSEANQVVGKSGLTYTLEFDYKGRKIEASTVIPAKPTGFKLDKYEMPRTKIDLSGGFGGGGGFQGTNNTTPIIASWINPESDYHFLAAENIETTPENVLTLPSGVTLPSRRFTQSPVLGTSSNLQPPSFEYFGKYNVILYRVNVEYADLYRSGGTTTQNISTPPSNIKNGLGIFTGINSDTLRLTVTKQ